MLCSCRAPVPRQRLAPQDALAPPCPAASCPPEAAAAAATAAPVVPPYAPAPLPYQVTGDWAAPGIALPWPEDEYVRDGGDDGAPVTVAPDWTVYGLELEDTVAHYDTADGRTLVEPSNKVSVYAPCFGAVRVVTRLAANEQAEPVIGIEQPVRVVRHEETLIPASSLQREQAERQAGARSPACI